MRYVVALLEVNDEVLAQMESDFTTEMGWVGDSIVVADSVDMTDFMEVRVVYDSESPRIEVIDS